MSRGMRRDSAALLVMGLVALAVVAGAADAEPQFGSYGTAASQFNEPNGIAIDQESGDVYILDTNNDRVEKFTNEGAFLLAWGWGVADHGNALQTCTAATRCVAGTPGDGDGQLRFAEGVAVDNDPQSLSQHDVYVVDIENHRVEKFSPTGQFLLMFGGRVNATADKTGDVADEDICPVKPGDVCTEGAAGDGDGEFEFRVEGNFISVGSTGTVYVGDRNRVEEFSPNGTYVSQIVLTPKLVGEGEPGGTIALALNPTGDLYTIRHGVSGVQEYSPQGQLLQTLNEEAGPENNESPTPAITVGPEGHVFLDFWADEEHRVLEYDSEGVELASFDEGMPDALHGLAYDDVDGKLFLVSGRITRVRVIAPPPLASLELFGFKALPWLLGP